MKFGMSSYAFSDLSEEKFIKLKEADVELIEVSASDQNYADSLDWDKIVFLSEKYGIKLWSYHLPYAPFSKINIASTNEEMREYTVDYFKKSIEKISRYGIKIVVIHPSAEPYHEWDRKDAMEASKKSLKELAEFADKFGIQIAVEDLPRTCLGRNSSDISELISAHKSLRVTFDTNHLLSQKNKEFIEELGDKIITTHFSDYDFKNERHWLPGEGKVNWVEVMEALEKAGYNGPVLYEICLDTPDTGTIDRRQMTFFDIKENYISLTNKKQPVGLGKINENKCLHWLEM